MLKKNHDTKRTRHVILLVIVVAICFLLFDCAHSLRLAFNNNVETLPLPNQHHPELTTQKKTHAPSPPAATEKTLVPTDSDHDRSETLQADGHQQAQRPVASSPVKPVPLNPHTMQDSNPDHQRGVSTPNKEPIKKAKAVVELNPSVSSHAKAQKTIAGSATQALELHQGDSEVETGESFGETFTDSISGMEFILVKGGCYQMGSDIRRFEGPAHEVCVDDFYMSKYEVTQKQWNILMGRDFSYFNGNSRPVERITWYESQRFIRQLNDRSGKAYRLPTEAEWEYAARSGGEDEQYAGTSEEKSLPGFAWHQFNSNRQTHMVGVKKPNRLGLHDMSGNVWEWCSDWYDDNYYAKSQSNNPQGPGNGFYRVIRGGEWELPSGLARTTYREAAKPDTRRNDIGFRLALTTQ